MSTKDRKARKRAGERFVKAPKEATPREERFVPLVLKKGRDGILGYYPSNRAMKRIKRQQDAVAGRSRWNKEVN